MKFFPISNTLLMPPIKHFLRYKILTPKTFRLGKNLSFPLIIKPINGGSSVGIKIIKSKDELNKIKFENWVYNMSESNLF